MALEMRFDYRLRWMDFDKRGNIQPFALFDMFQDLAIVHAEEMGIGRDAMMEKGVFWVVVRQKYEVVREPAHYQVVTVRTWPHSPSRFSFKRDFQVLDAAGDVLVKASAEWVLVDFRTRKFATMKDHYEAPDDFVEDRAFQGKLRKIADFAEGNRPVRTIAPGFSDIDLNGHVNNAKYANYVLDALDPGESERIRSLQIDYRHEVPPDEPLHVHTLVSDGHVLQKGVRDDGTIAFACAIDLDDGR